MLERTSPIACGECRVGLGGATIRAELHLVQVKMECSHENKIVAVDEPAKCTYSMRLMTPAVCNSHHAAIVRMNLESTQASGRVEDLEEEP